MLYKEFAIEPNQIRDIGDLRLLEARFGYDKGALISSFPSKWFKAVLASLRAMNDDHRVDSLTDILRDIREKALHRYSRDYDSDNWLTAAKSSHEVKPFHRILESTLSEPPVFIGSLDNLENNDFDLITHCTRTASDMPAVVETLLSGAEKVTLVDPYACVTKSGYKKTLLALMRKCQKPDVTFVVFSKEAGKSDWASRKIALNTFAQQLPANITIHWCSLDDGGTGFLHNRFIFTAKGGINFDRGFDEPSDRDQKQSRNDLNPLSINHLNEYTQTYNTAQLTAPLTLAQPIWRSK